MFRLLRSLILLALLAFFGLGAYFWTTRIPTVERFLSNKLNAKVSIESIDIGVKTLVIRGLRITNPSLSALPYAFQSESITLELMPYELLRKTIKVDRLQISGGVFSVQLYNGSGSDNNWARLLNALPPSGDHTFVIRSLILDNIQCSAFRSNGRQLTLPTIPHLEFNNLGQKHPLTLPQAERILFQTILSTLTSRPHLGGILDNIILVPSQLLGKGFVQEDETILDAGLDIIRRKTNEVTEFLQGLF